VNSSPLWINVNGSLLPAGTPFLSAGSRAFRYGDGIFETMLVQQDHIRLADYHFDRLEHGLRYIRCPLPPGITRERLNREILELCDQNEHRDLSRARLVLFRGEGGIFDKVPADPQYVIETWPLPPASPELNQHGLVVDVYSGGTKSCDGLANLKSNNYLIYALAAGWATDAGLDDCLVLNSRGTLADTTIANLFYCQNGQWYTPPLSDGCVAGVMRRYLLTAMPAAGFPVSERTTTIDDLLNAEEVCLTNAIRGIRWVAAFRDTRYSNTLTTALHRKLLL
jgi:branched-chain amino acid aminotransferase